MQTVALSQWHATSSWRPCVMSTEGSRPRASGWALLACGPSLAAGIADCGSLAGSDRLSPCHLHAPLPLPLPHSLALAPLKGLARARRCTAPRAAHSAIWQARCNPCGSHGRQGPPPTSRCANNVNMCTFMANYTFYIYIYSTFSSRPMTDSAFCFVV